jgi:hypothetical protein
MVLGRASPAEGFAMRTAIAWLLTLSLLTLWNCPVDGQQSNPTKQSESLERSLKFLENLKRSLNTPARDSTESSAQNLTVDEFVNAQIKRLASSKIGDRCEAVIQLGKIGPGANAAIPAIRKAASDDPEPAVRALAEKCIAQISSPTPNKPAPRKVIRMFPDEPQPQRKIDEKPKVLNRWGIANLKNDTAFPVAFDYKVGDGQWKAKVLNQGFSTSFIHEHQFDKVSPPVRIRMTQGTNSKEYKLERLAVPERKARLGKQYIFRARGNIIDLFEK